MPPIADTRHGIRRPILQALALALALGVATPATTQNLASSGVHLTPEMRAALDSLSTKLAHLLEDLEALDGFPVGEHSANVSRTVRVVGRILGDGSIYMPPPVDNTGMLAEVVVDASAGELDFEAHLYAEGIEIKGQAWDAGRAGYAEKTTPDGQCIRVSWGGASP